jgi:hypothetical protein
MFSIAVSCVWESVNLVLVPLPELAPEPPLIRLCAAGLKSSRYASEFAEDVPEPEEKSACSSDWMLVAAEEEPLLPDPEESRLESW